MEAIVRPRATVIPADGDAPDASVEMPVLDQGVNLYGGVEFAFINEGGEKPQSDLAFKGIELEPEEFAGLIVVTEKLLRNAPAMSTLIERILRRGLAAFEDATFLSLGSGIKSPLAMFHANNGALVTVPRNTANVIKHIDLAAMLAKFLEDGAGSPAFVVSRTARAYLMTLADTAGNLIWAKSAAEGLPETLLGYPMLVDRRAPAYGSRGDIRLVDFAQYLIKDGAGPFLASSEHVHFTRNKVVIKIFSNVDGQPWMNEPIDLEDGQPASPFVELTVPS